MQYPNGVFGSSETTKVWACVVALLPGVALAQQRDESAATQNEVIVSATRTPVAVQDSLVPAQVIDREQIERSQAQSLLQVLEGQAGIALNNQGGLGKVSGLHLRGTDASQVLVLIDGIRIGSATAGQVALQDIPLDQIERIEIVRGPRSSLYGSEAIGGVIQIFTRRGGEGLTGQASLGGGSNNLFAGSGGVSYRNERGFIGADVARQRTDGINACRGRAPDPAIAFDFGAGCGVNEPDRDGYRNDSLNVRGGYHFGTAWKLEGSFLQALGKNKYDGAFANFSKTRQQAMGGKLSFTPSDRVAVMLSAGRSRDESNDYSGDVFASFFGTRRDQAALQGDFTVAAGQLISFGADWQRDRVDSNTPFDVASRDNTAGFAEYQGSFAAHRVQLSLRRDDNEQFGAHTTGSAAYGYSFGNGLKFTASYATGFKAPSFNDLYYPCGFPCSNPNLKPESSKSANVGIAQYGQGWNWTFNVYETRIEDLISFDLVAFLPNNIDRARIRGAELTVDTRLAGWEVSAQLSHTDPRNDSGGNNDGNLLPRRPRDTARLDVDRAFGDFRVGVTAYGASHSYDQVDNVTRLAGYGTLGLRAEYRISGQWKLQAQARNVFDRRYETVAWYNQPGREYTLTLRYLSQ
jgi:vitamin B12 transporter